MKNVSIFLYLFLLFIIFPFTNLKAQIFAEGFGVGMGVSVTTLDVGNASPVGMFFDIDLGAFHMDAATNFASGKGEYLEFSSSYTAKANKQVWYAFNAGINLAVKNWFVVTPKAGLVMLRDIWEDPIGWNTYYEAAAGTKVQVGADIKKQINQFYLKAGTSITEVFSIGIGFVI